MVLPMLVGVGTFHLLLGHHFVHFLECYFCWHHCLGSVFFFCRLASSKIIGVPVALAAAAGSSSLLARDPAASASASESSLSQPVTLGHSLSLKIHHKVEPA